MVVDDIPSAVTDPKRLDALRRLMLLDSPNVTAFDHLTNLAVHFLHVSAALVSLIDETHEVFVSCSGPVAPLLSTHQLPLKNSFCYHCVVSGQPLIIEDSHQISLQENPTLREMNIRAYVGIPLTLADGYNVGAVCVACTEPRAWTGEDITALQDLTALVMGQIELRAALRAREHLDDTLEQQIEQSTVELAQSDEALHTEISEHQQDQQRLHRQNRYLSAINEIALAVIHRVDLEALLRVITRRAGTLAEAADASIWLVDPDAAGLTIRSGTGNSQKFIGIQVRSGEGMAGKVWQSGQPLIVNDYATWSGKLVGDFREAHAMVNMPLRSEGEVLGVLAIAHSQPQMTFEPNEIALLERFAEIAAIAIANAQTNIILRAELAERKRAEALLEQERNLLRTLIDNLPDYIFVKDTQGRFIISNDAHTRAAHADSDANVVGKLPADLFPSALAEQFHADDLAILHSGQALINGERMTIDAAGQPRWVLTTKVPFKDKQGQVLGLVGISRDITERKQAQDKLQESVIENAHLYEQLLRYADNLEERVTERTQELQQAKEHVEAIFDTSSDAILVIEPVGVIKQANPAFYELFGYPFEATFSHSLLTLADTPSVEKLSETLQHVMQTGVSQRLEIVARRQDDGTFDADLALAPIQRPAYEVGGGIVGIVCNIRDMTQRKLMEHELRQTLEKERELNELKSRFVSMVSHEFRTPLAVILAASNILERYSDRMSNTEKQDRFNKIATGVAQMTSLLEDVLTLSKGEAGQLSFRPVHLDLEHFCQDLIAEVRTIWGKQHTFEFTRHGEAIRVMMDTQLLQAILVNLLLNAVKYSASGSTVYFDLGCEVDAATFRIRDEGLGIPADDQEKLFDAFHRAENVSAIGGNGLGLTIVKQAVIRHGGSIRFESTLNVGTVFVVTIPHIKLE